MPLPGTGGTQDVLKWLLGIALDLPSGERDPVVKFLGGLIRQEGWGYVNINPEQQEILLDAIIEGQRPHQTMRVWAAALKYIEYGTNELMASHIRISEECGITQREVSRSFGYLVEIGACRRIRRGWYKFNPHVIWKGPLAGRGAVAKNFAPLRPTAKAVPLHVATKEDAHV